MITPTQSVPSSASLRPGDCDCDCAGGGLKRVSDEDEGRFGFATPVRARPVRLGGGAQPLAVAVGRRQGRKAGDAALHAVALAPPAEGLVEGLGLAADAHAVACGKAGVK